ncbi:hypothetical protein HMPREF0556_10594 [Listeria grayi DSM 20601]|uniref:Uncharacterized protein n=1 Tax=Listeria grayi DSM 20601 TaxID=525367 RepID=D7UWF7_LISGR|nr:hypothetical protein HMPREF0556_10594 [Listeria grayi DSM 20601]
MTTPYEQMVCSLTESLFYRPKPKGFLSGWRISFSLAFFRKVFLYHAKAFWNHRLSLWFSIKHNKKLQLKTGVLECTQKLKFYLPTMIIEFV